MANIFEYTGSDLREYSKKELADRIKDVKFYLENFTKIKGKKPGQLIPFILNEAQKDLFNAVNASARVIILKARQIGFSTAMVGYFYHWTITNPGTNTALIAYNSDLAAELLDKVKTFYKTTPAQLRPTLHYNSKYELSFPNLESKIMVLPSHEDVGRGYTLHNCLATELAFWDKAEEKMQTLEASVPQDGKLVIESTPNGVGNTYHKMWYAKDNGYVKKEFGWWWGYTKEEIDVIRKRMNNERKFAQEYGLEFLAAGRPVFDTNVVKSMRSGILNTGETRDNSFKVYEREGLRVYEEPDKDTVYVCGVDVSEGVDGGDYSVATFFRRDNGEEAAMYRGLIPPDRLSDFLNTWGRWYNDALMVVEINNHGLTTVTALKNLLYPSIYVRPAKFEVAGMPLSSKLGWKTTKVTKPLMIDDLAQMCRDRLIVPHSKDLLDEMMTFVYDDNGNMVPISADYHDDCIFSAALAVQGFKVTFHDRHMGQLDYSEHLPTNFNY